LNFGSRIYLINPDNEGIREISYQDLDCFGPFGIIKDLAFPDEIQDQK
jgi:hypothetical protein